MIWLATALFIIGVVVSIWAAINTDSALLRVVGIVLMLLGIYLANYSVARGELTAPDGKPVTGYSTATDPNGA